MNNLETIEIFEATRDECKNWIENAQLLLSGKNIDHLEEPFMPKDCQIGIWITANSETVNHYTELVEIRDQHDVCHKIYIQLYNETLRIYNPKTHDELNEFLEDLEHETAKLMYYLNQAEECLADDPNAFMNIPLDQESDSTLEKIDPVISVEEPQEMIEHTTEGMTNADLYSDLSKDDENTDELDISAKEEQQPETILENATKFELDDTEPKKVEELLEIEVPEHTKTETQVDPDVQDLKSDLAETAKFDDTEQVVNILTMHEELHHQLQEQDLKQIKLEKELTQRELDTLDERKLLNEQAIDQLKQRQSLKQQEVDILETEHQKVVNSIIQEQTKRKQELVNIQEDQESKQKELQEMEHASVKLEERKLENKKHEQKKLEKLIQQQDSLQSSLDQLKDDEESKLRTLEELQKQVSTLTDDVQKIRTARLSKSEELDQIKAQKSECEDLIKQENIKQEQLNQHIKKAEDNRAKDANKLEEQRKVISTQLDSIAKELSELNERGQKAKEQKEKEVSQLEDQKKIKQKNLEQLEKSQQDKKQELSQLEELFNSTFNEIERSKNTQSYEELEKV